MMQFCAPEKFAKNLSIKYTFVHVDECEDPDIAALSLGRRKRSSSLPPEVAVPADKPTVGKAADATIWEATDTCAPVKSASETSPQAPVLVRGGIPSAVAEAGSSMRARDGATTPIASLRGVGILDGRRLDSKDTRLCCTIQVLDCEYVVTFSAKPVNHLRGGSNFSASKGLGFVSVKSNTPVDASLKIAVTIGSDRSTCSSTFRACHNFLAETVLRFQPENGIDLRSALEHDQNASMPVLQVSLSVVNEEEAAAVQLSPEQDPSAESCWSSAAHTSPMMWPTYLGYLPLQAAHVVDVQGYWYQDYWGEYASEYASEEDFAVQQHMLEAMVLGEAGTP